MSQLFIQPLEYRHDNQDLFDRIVRLTRPVILDSGHAWHSSERVSSEGNPQASDRFDIATAEPVMTLTSQCVDGATQTIIQQHGSLRTESHSDPFTLLEQVLNQFDRSPEETTVELPFYGGALGYFGYDLARGDFQQGAEIAADEPAFPVMDVGIYLWTVVIDHVYQRSWFVARSEMPAADRERILKLLMGAEASAVKAPSFHLRAPFSSNMAQADYQQKFAQIMDYIKAGDTYQVNLAQRFSAPYGGSEWDAYTQLRQQIATPFSAFMQTDHGAVLSLSPERFIHCDNQGQVETRPIKGTRPRGASAADDEALAHALVSSAKDQAENLMIVDLLRNDLSKNCALDSVRVPELFRLESYTNVHHLVSVVQGRLRSGRSSLDLLKGCFPGGSITGAPKLRAMEIIEELEPHHRSVYCGSVGYVGFNGAMDSNIAIRTLLCTDGQVYCWGGGGIVFDSDCNREYEESQIKVSHIIAKLEQSLSSQEDAQHA